MKMNTQYNDYINASWVLIENIQVIAAQSPLPSTIETFFQMIQENNVSDIVTLTKDQEQQDADGIVKIYKYISFYNILKI